MAKAAVPTVRGTANIVMTSSAIAPDTTTEPTPSGYRWAVLAAATLTQACACFLIQGLGALGPTLQADLRLSATQLGLLMSAAQVAPLAGLMIAGELLDRFGERPVVVAGTSLLALALLGASFASGHTGLLLWLALAGAGYSSVQPGGSQSVARWFAASQRGLAMGIRQAGLPLGGAVAAAVLPAVAAACGWRMGMLVGGALALAGAAIFLGVCRSPHAGPRATRAALPRPPWTWRSALDERRRWLATARMRGVVCAGIVLVGAQICLLMFVVADLHERLAVPVDSGARLLAAMLAAGAAGRILLAAWSDRSRHGRFLPILVCLLASALGLALLASGLARSAWALGALALWMGFFGFGWYGPWVTCAAEASAPGRTGSGLALAMVFNQIAIVVCPPLWGAWRDRSGGFVPGWIALAVLLLLATVVIVPLLQRAPLHSLPPRPGNPS